MYISVVWRQRVLYTIDSTGQPIVIVPTIVHMYGIYDSSIITIVIASRQCDGGGNNNIII